MAFVPVNYIEGGVAFVPVSHTEESMASKSVSSSKGAMVAVRVHNIFLIRNRTEMNGETYQTLGKFFLPF